MFYFTLIKFNVSICTPTTNLLSVKILDIFPNIRVMEISSNLLKIKQLKSQVQQQDKSTFVDNDFFTEYYIG